MGQRLRQMHGMLAQPSAGWGAGCGTRAHCKPVGGSDVALTGRPGSAGGGQLAVQCSGGSSLKMLSGLQSLMHPVALNQSHSVPLPAGVYPRSLGRLGPAAIGYPSWRTPPTHPCQPSHQSRTDPAPPALTCSRPWGSAVKGSSLEGAGPPLCCAIGMNMPAALPAGGRRSKVQRAGGGKWRHATSR